MPELKPLPYALTKQEAEDRMMVNLSFKYLKSIYIQYVVKFTQLREFFHRFSELLRFPKTHRDALDDFSRPLELNPVKNMFSSLLDILTEDATEKDVQEVGARLILAGRKTNLIGTGRHSRSRKSEWMFGDVPMWENLVP